MTTLIVLASITAYAIIATSTARRLAWKFYQGRRAVSTSFLDRFDRETATMNAVLVSFFLLPVAIYLVASDSISSNGFMLPPKNIRAMQRVERAEAYSKELERKLHIR